jgi:hypothetical protein
MPGRPAPTARLLAQSSHRRGHAPVAALLALAGLAACADSVPALPAGLEADRSLSFRVDLAQAPGAAVKAFGGLDGTPTAMLGTTDLIDAYRAGGVQVAGLPRGSSCQLTMDAIFPNTSALPTDDTAYSDGPLHDAILRTLGGGMYPLLYLMYDLGTGSCQAQAPAHATGDPAVPDLEKGDGLHVPPTLWAQVAQTMLQRTMNVNGQGLLPPYVGFVPDALTEGGMERTSWLELYEKTAPMLHDTSVFPLKDDKSRPFVLLAPLAPLGDPAELADGTTAIASFLTLLENQAALAPDVFAFTPVTGALLQDHMDLVAAVRAELDTPAMKLTGLPIAEVGVRLSPDAWNGLAGIVPDDVRSESAYAGAWLSALKVVLQDQLSEPMVSDRWGGPQQPADLAGRDLFVDATGAPLPAMLAMFGFSELASWAAVRLAVVDTTPPVATSPAPAMSAATVTPASPAAGTALDKGVAVLAAASPAGGHVYVVLAAVEPDRIGQRLTYTLSLTGATQADWTLQRAVIDSDATRYGYVESTPTTATGGTLTVPRDIVVPSVQFLDLGSCQATATPAGGQWTPDFPPEPGCSCSAANTTCNASYVAAVDSVQGDVARLRFRETGGGFPASERHWWLATSDSAAADCTQLGASDSNGQPLYAVQQEGTWTAGAELDIDANLWSDPTDCQTAAPGSAIQFYLITDQPGQAGSRVLFQKAPLRFVHD